LNVWIENGAVPSDAGSRSAVHAERRAGRDVGVLVDAVRPDDPFGRRHPPSGLVVRPFDLRLPPHRVGELAPADREDPARAADLVLLRRERLRVVGRALRLVREPAARGLEAERVAVLRIVDRGGRLHDLEAEIERVPAEDVAHVVAAHDHQLEARLLGDGLQAGGAHLARAPDGEPVAGDHERLAAVHALSEIGHQESERAGLPALIERIEALGHAVLGRSDLVRVDGVELLPGAAPRPIPEDQRRPADAVL